MPSLNDLKSAAALNLTEDQKNEIFLRFSDMDHKFWQRVRTDLPEQIPHSDIVSVIVSAYITLAARQIGLHGHCTTCVLQYVQTFGNACLAEFHKDDKKNHQEGPDDNTN